MAKRKRGRQMDVIVDGGRLVAQRLMPDPSISDAEFYHRQSARPGTRAGMAYATVNLRELIGGLARIRCRTDVHEAAAARYRLLWERAQIGGARAIDYERAKVDTSGGGQELVSEIGEDARRAYSDAVRRLGLIRSSLVERIVVHDQSVRDVAGGGASRQRLVAELLQALDDLAVHFRLAGN